MEKRTINTVFKDYFFALSFFLSIFSLSVNGQEYPDWFIKSPSRGVFVTIGVVKTGFYKDSSYSHAFKLACEKAAKYYSLSFSLNQTFLSAIDKKYWQSFVKSVSFDTSLISFFYDNYSIIDSFQTKEHTIVLIADPDYKINISNGRMEFKHLKKPKWVETIPDDKEYIYAVGSSQDYFYETSSWESAEQSALLELAKQKYLVINENLYKEKANFSDTYISEQNESIETMLSDIQVIERWLDEKNKIFYVLMRSRK